MTATPVEFTDKNLYSYCDNNPVIRKDEKGEFWNVAAGSLIGMAISVGTEVVVQLFETEGNIKNIDKKSIFTAAISGALGGALAASGLGFRGQAVGNALLNAGTTAITSVQENGIGALKTKSVRTDIAISGCLGAVSGLVGGDGARVGKSTYGKVMKSTKTLKQYYKRNSYSYTTLNPYKKVLTKLRKTLRVKVTKNTAKRYTKGAIITSIGSRWRKLFNL